MTVKIPDNVAPSMAIKTAPHVNGSTNELLSNFKIPDQLRAERAAQMAHPTEAEPQEHTPIVTRVSMSATYRMQPLPDSAKLPTSMGESACNWLDQYIQHSQKWSPRGHEDAHEAIGLWILSTVAARRVRLNFGGHRYTNLYIAQTIRTSKRTKTGTAKLATNLLSEIGLDHLLLPDENTPQSMVRSMTAMLPEKWGDFTEDAQNRLRKSWAFAGQRGWFYDEFGGKVRSMMNDGSVMSEFRSLFRKFDDNQPRYEYSTIAHGSLIIDNPYLALLGNTTPADLQPFARKGGALWNDGFWARFVFIAADPAIKRNNARYPNEEWGTPFELIAPLQQWHARLGVPRVDVTERIKDGEPSGKYDLQVSELPINTCTFGDGVFDAFYNYDDALGNIAFASSNQDLDGNYTRLPEKALRVAMLFASLENNNRIEMPQWARAQEIAERWRQNLHNLYATIVDELPTKKEGFEERIRRMIQESGALTAREIIRHIKGLPSEDGNNIIQNMVKTGELLATQSGRTTIYTVAPEE